MSSNTTQNDSIVSKVSQALRADHNAVAVVTKEVQGKPLKRFIAFGSEFQWAVVKGKRGVATLEKTLGDDDLAEEDVQIKAISEIPTTVKKQIENVRNNDPSSSGAPGRGSGREKDWEDNVTNKAREKDARTEINPDSPRPEDQVHSDADEKLTLISGQADDRDDDDW